MTFYFDKISMLGSTPNGDKKSVSSSSSATAAYLISHPKLYLTYKSVIATNSIKK
ncbi:MAG: hypothetical protein ACJAQ2_000474 [Vicingaceae bacterium]|jgi:hypothetical protein